MSRRNLAAAVAAGALMFAGAAAAQQTSLGVTAGTTGLGVELGYDFSDAVGLRANGNLLGFSHDVESDGIQYDGKLKLRSLGVLGDFYPFESGFRVTGGVYYNDNHVNITATPSGPVTIGGTTYTPAEVGALTGAAEYNTLTPYAGLGYTSSRGEPGLAFVFDAGVMFQGRPDITLAGSGPITATPSFQADLERERRQIRDDLKWTRFYPVVRLGVAYRF